VLAAEPGLSALGQFLKAVRSTPSWVSACMALRSRAGAMFGLNDLGALNAVLLDHGECDYKPGDHVGIFTLFKNTHDEVLLGDRDKHLDVTLSVHTATEKNTSVTLVTVTTVVHVHNLLGRVHMVPVAPMYCLITPTLLRAVARHT
jgi:hypothetical protein